MSMLQENIVIKQTVGHTVTGLFVLVVGVGTGSVNATIISALVGIIGLGSISAASITQNILYLRRRSEDIVNGDLDTEVVTQREDELGQISNSIDNMRLLLSEKNQKVEMSQEKADEARKEAEIAQKRALERELEHKEIAQNYAETMKDIAEGDITKRINVSEEYESMETIGTEFNNVIDNLSEVFLLFDRLSNNFEQNSNKLSNSKKEIEKSVSDTIEMTADIEYNTTKQNTDLEEFNNSINKLCETSEQLTTNINKIPCRIDDIKEKSSESYNKSSTVIDEIERIQSDINEVVDLMNEFSRSAKDISEINDNINVLADQINTILSDDSVSDYTCQGDKQECSSNGIKQLATETEKHTDNIDKIITDIHKRTVKTRVSTRKIIDDINESKSNIETVLNNVNLINESAINIDKNLSRTEDIISNHSKRIRSVSCSSNEIRKDSDQIYYLSNNILDILETQENELESFGVCFEEFYYDIQSLSNMLEEFNINSQKSSRNIINKGEIV